MIRFCSVVLLFSCSFAVVTGQSRGIREAQNNVGEIVLRFGGDVLLAHRYEEQVGGDINRAFKNFDLFHTDDLSIVNLEVPVTDRGVRRVKPFTFRMKRKFLESLTSGGVDAVNIANNHIFDFGEVGLFDTIAALDSARMPFVGAGRNHDEAHRPFVKEIRGRRIALLGYYGGGEAPKAFRNLPGVANRELSLIRRDIRRAKETENADYVVVNFHWGTEKARRPDAQQRAFARSVIDAGADAIIGHHPHVLQGIELYKNKPIVYSLGNLVFGGNSINTDDTGVFEIRLSNGSAAYKFIPVRITNWSAAVMEEPSASKLINQMKNLSTIFPKSIFN